MSQKEPRFLPDLRDQLVQVVGGRRAGASGDLLRRGRAAQQPVLHVVDEFVLLPLLDRLDGQAQLLCDLVVRHAVEVRDPRVDIHHGGHGAQQILARLFLIVHERLRQIAFVASRAVHGDSGGVFNSIHPIDARLNRHPLQCLDKPARRHDAKLGYGLGRVGELPGRKVALRVVSSSLMV
jgi:hypothetical protein